MPRMSAAALLIVAAGCNGGSVDDPLVPIPHASTVASGDYFSCALDRGEIRCVGLDEEHRPEGADYIEVVAGRTHVCGLRGDGTIDCADDPWQAPLDETYSRLAAGDRVTCGIESYDRTITCWGEEHVAAPTDVGFHDLAVIAVEEEGVRWQVACGLLGDGTLVCAHPSIGPPQLSRLLVTSSGELCGAQADDGFVWCADDDFQEELAPFASTGGAVGFCAGASLDADGRPWGWRALQHPGCEPTDRYTEITAGAVHACGRNFRGEVSCYGYPGGQMEDDPGFTDWWSCDL